ncbi:hypothetical protein L596_017240 [Steinernema carpocapsae]|uniref:Uncharacterized protein n=1 Tax=Steinernema carpocapsae TaxID=34508 RepID=A0A4U5N1B2_STECR|nr:hypothetical protein L596_017240 [Steinernema carpocapsae]
MMASKTEKPQALNAEIDKALNGSLNKNISKVKLFHTRLYNYAIISYLTDEYKFKIKWKALYKNEPTTQVRFAVPGHGPAYYLQEDPHGFHVTRLSEHVFWIESLLRLHPQIRKYDLEPVLLPYSNPPNYLTNLERCPTKPKTNDEEVLILPSSGSDLYRDPKKINATKGTYFLNQVIDQQHRYRLHVELLEDEFGDPFFYHILTYMEHPTEVFSDDFLLSKKCYIRKFKKESAEIPRMLVVPLEYATEYVPLPRPSEVDSIPILEPTTATAEPTKTIVAGTKILGKKASNEECNYVIATVIMVLIALVVE